MTLQGLKNNTGVDIARLIIKIKAITITGGNSAVAEGSGAVHQVILRTGI